METWPIDSKKETKLFFPLQWKDEERNQTCFIRYDAERNLLKIVDDENVIVHLINPLDVIGVNVEVKLMQDFDEGDMYSKIGNEDVSLRGKNDNDLIPVDNQAKAILNLHTYPKSTYVTSFFCSKHKVIKGPCPDYIPGTGPRVAYPFSFPVAPAHDFEALNDLVQAIRDVAQLKKHDPKKSYLVLINPNSGTKKAEKHWKSIIQPILEKEAGISTTVRRTSFSGHATELIRDEGLNLIEKYAAIICLGGDGILYEVLQGLKQRHDFDRVLEHIPVGILGCGTSNGLAKSITFHGKVNDVFSIVCLFHFSSHRNHTGKSFLAGIYFSHSTGSNIEH